MKRTLLNIISLSAILTTIGFLMDGDVKEPSMAMRFTEFFAIMGIIFLFASTIYFSVNALTKKLQRIH
ncbi:MAG TPA: hypothetical protein VF455_03510 [Chryseobacterium sp.]